MKKLIILVASIILLSSCAFTEPSVFQIDNLSSYPIEVNILTLDKSLTIKKNKSEILVAYPQTIEIKISVPALDYTRTVTFNLEYLEKKRISFQLDEE